MWVYVSTVLLVFFVISFSIIAQEENVIRVETELINFEVSVIDDRGKPIVGLRPEDFQVFENGVERKIDFFESMKQGEKTRPLAIVFALDISGSVTEREIERLKFVISQFTNKLTGSRSYFAILTFGMSVKTILPLTNQKDKVKKSLTKLERERDGLSTHAYDAVDIAIRLLERQSPRYLDKQLVKRVIVLVTDGFPVGDVVSSDTVIERANKAEVTVHSIILPSYSIFQNHSRPLLTPLEASGLMERTGGRVFYPTTEDLEKILELLSEEIKGSYLLALYPSEESKQDGKFREILVKTRVENYRIRQNRRGYRFPLQ